MEHRIERRRALTEHDVEAIADELQTRGMFHVCRYDIEPQDMTNLLEFVRSFRDGAIDTRKAFRAAAIRMIVWGSIASAIALLEVKFRWIRPLLRFVSGG